MKKTFSTAASLAHMSVIIIALPLTGWDYALAARLALAVEWAVWRAYCTDLRPA